MKFTPAKRFLTFTLAAAMTCTVAFAPTAAAVTQVEIDALEQQQTQLEEHKSEVSENIDALEQEHREATAKKEALDGQMRQTQSEIRELTRQIAEYDKLIAQKQDETEQAQKNEREQWEKYRQRMRAMEENGVISYLAVLFESTNFADLLGRIDVVNRIMKSDKQLYEDIENARLASIAAAQ
ncbi:MAG: hypothetical protein IJ072_05475, partial [Oscillospiraceae bacterium]|nr:hypothetical protein [Oscillospiraceae bacterium]